MTIEQVVKRGGKQELEEHIENIIPFIHGSDSFDEIVELLYSICVRLKVEPKKPTIKSLAKKHGIKVSKNRDIFDLETGKRYNNGE
jgi:hypothetical protein